MHLGMCYKTVADVDDGFGDRTPACREKTPSLRMTLKWLEGSRLWLQCVRNWWKTLILTNQHHFLIVKLPGWDKPRARFSAWSHDMEGHDRKCVERHCELAKQKKGPTIQSFSSLFGWSPNIKKKELANNGELPEVCSHIVLKCLCLARIGRLDILSSVNKLARSVTNWTQGCDRRLARLIPYIHQTNDFRQYCHVGNTAHQCWLGLFQDSDFAGDLEDSKSTSGGTLCIFWKSYFSVCWIMHGWITCSRSLGHSDWSVAFN